MGAAREKVQADFDLERFIDMFDEALTSNDERVVNALRSLMMMVILTKPEVKHEGHDRNHGPLRQLYDDMHHLNRRMHSMEDELRQITRHVRDREESEAKAYSQRDYWEKMRNIPYSLKEDEFLAKMSNTLGKTPQQIAKKIP